MEKKKLEEIRTLLIIVDVLNGFIREGKMADPYTAHVIPEIVRLAEMTIEEGGAIAFIKDNHELGCREFDRYPEHCVKGTSEAEVVDELKPYEKDALVYYKNSTSAIFAPHFMEDIMRMKNLRRVIGSGLEADICDMNLFIPLNNYFDETNRNVEIIVPENAVETFDGVGHDRDEYRNMAFKLMEQGGIKLVKKYKSERGKVNENI